MTAFGETGHSETASGNPAIEWPLYTRKQPLS